MGGGGGAAGSALHTLLDPGPEGAKRLGSEWLGLVGPGHCELGSEAVQQRALALSNHPCVERRCWRGVGAGWGPRQGECQTGFCPAITALPAAIY